MQLPNVAYDQQLVRKRRKLEKSLRLVTKFSLKEVENPYVLPWIKDLLAKQKAGKGKPMCCDFVKLVSADDQVTARDYYRNKNEFIIGMSPDSCGKDHDYHVSKTTIGYFLEMQQKGQISVGAADDDCLTTGKLSLQIAKSLMPVIEKLGRPIYDRITHKGYWRQLVVRESSRTNQVIVAVAVNPYEEDIDIERQQYLREADKSCQETVVTSLRHLFSKLPNIDLGVFWQPSADLSAIGSEMPYVHLYGLDSIQEQICGLNFRIQQTDFFQVNTIMAKRLYTLIGELSNVSKDTVVLDVCCGTGTIGLSLAKKAHLVVGIEMNKAAVADAKYNASLNQIDNADFFSSPEEWNEYF